MCVAHEEAGPNCELMHNGPTEILRTALSQYHH